MIKKILFLLFAVTFILTVTSGIILYAKGYRISPENKNVTATGILSISSYPEKASIYVNGALLSATNASLSLAPGDYLVKISKDGYIPWEKNINIGAGIVSQADALLIPQNPSLRAVTNSGIFSPSLAQSGTKVAFIITQSQATVSAEIQDKTGLWVADLRSGPLANRAEPKQIYKGTSRYPLEDTEIFWSPDEKELILAVFQKTGKTKDLNLALRLLPDRDNSPVENVTFTYDKILSLWSEERNKELVEKIGGVSKDLAFNLLQNTTGLSFSPDDTKILYEATASSQLAPVINPPLIGTNSSAEDRNILKDSYYAYDIKEDKNYFLFTKKDINPAVSPKWYSDSKHVVFTLDSSIVFIDYDGTNQRNVYSGPFEKDFLAPLSAENKIAILTSLNNPKGLPNIYEIDLR